MDFIPNNDDNIPNLDQTIFLCYINSKVNISKNNVELYKNGYLDLVGAGEYIENMIYQKLTINTRNFL